ncbi:MAG: histone deacetylase family protein [Pseudomonadales bacterium]|nr:histone deacetylase family protein [Pseudomonadales bacterium]
MSIAIYTHPDCLEHDPGPGHPENAGRLRAILAALHSASYVSRLNFVTPPPGRDEQILLAHSPEHLAHIKASAPASGRVALDGDTLLSGGSLTAARYGAGAACQGLDDVLAGRFSKAFCATRPPGHHATRNQAMGFCLFNNIGIAALHAQQQHRLQRVAIVDFDVHHGNGSQDILRGREGILYISTHQSPLYPGTGTSAENIPGNIANFPLPAGTGGELYREIFLSAILPQLHAFKPDMILISAGFDAHRLDPLAGLALDTADYLWLGEQLGACAEQYCQGHLLAVLEGGYNLQVLGDCVAAFLEGLL